MWKEEEEKSCSLTASCTHAESCVFGCVCVCVAQLLKPSYTVTQKRCKAQHRVCWVRMPDRCCIFAQHPYELKRTHWYQLGRSKCTQPPAADTRRPGLTAFFVSRSRRVALTYTHRNFEWYYDMMLLLENACCAI